MRVLLIEPALSPHLERIQRAGVTADLDIQWLEERNLPPSSEAGTVSLVIIGPGVSEPLETLRHFIQLGPAFTGLILVASAASAERLRGERQKDPALAGDHEVLALELLEDLAAALHEAHERARRRNQFADSVQRLEHQIASITTPDGESEPSVALTARYLANVMAQASQAMISTDEHSIILTWNASAESLFGFPADDVIGRPLAFLDPPDGTPPGLEPLSGAAERVLRSSLPQQVDASGKHKADGVVELAASVAPVRDTDGTLLGLSILARDSAEQRRMEEAFRDAHRQRDEFLAIMSHELRTPLTSIIGYTDMLLRGMTGPLPDRTTHYLSNVRAAGGRLLDLVNGLLDFSRLESGAEELHAHPVEVSHLARRAMDLVRSQAGAKAITVDGTFPDRATLVLADPEKVLNVVCNLLSNAVKFTPAGGAIHLDIRQDPDASDMVRIAVQDTGLGLSPVQVDKVWDRFYQADPSLTRQQGGVGLGLAISRQQVLLHGGRVGAESPGAGQGATFWLTLPRAT